MGGNKMENLIGQKFNRLTVIAAAEKKNGKVQWFCRCDCGNEIIVNQYKLISGHTKSCGCLKKEKRIDLVGQRFGRLVVTSLNRAETKDGKTRLYWNCICDCGNEHIVRGDILKSGMSQSCGCYAKDHSLIPLPEYTKEFAFDKLKNIYKYMKQRCYNPNHTKYRNHGGRGIKICDEWLGDSGFDQFYKDMGLPPSHGHQIDRINNDGNYAASNCRWVTNTENNRNKRTNHLLTLGNKTLCVTEWAEELGISRDTLSKRVRMGWSNQKILTTPVDLRYSRK
jgi:hypothetical protein